MTISDEEAFRLARDALYAAVSLDNEAATRAVMKIVESGENAILELLGMMIPMLTTAATHVRRELENRGGES